jgi:hypothetical protein
LFYEEKNNKGEMMKNRILWVRTYWLERKRDNEEGDKYPHTKRKNGLKNFSKFRKNT